MSKCWAGAFISRPGSLSHSCLFESLALLYLTLCMRVCVCVRAHASVCPSAPFLFPLRQNHLSWLLNMDENSKRMRSRHPKGLYHLPTPKDMSLDGEQNWSPQNAPLRLKYSFKLIIFKKQQTPETLRTPWRVPFLREIRVSTRALRLQEGVAPSDGRGGRPGL